MANQAWTTSANVNSGAESLQVFLETQKVEYRRIKKMHRFVRRGDEPDTAVSNRNETLMADERTLDSSDFSASDA